MKKYLTTILILIVMLTGLLALPTVLAESNSDTIPTPKASDIATELPSIDDYMSIVKPTRTASDGDIIIASTDTDLYMNRNGKASSASLVADTDVDSAIENVKHFGNIIPDSLSSDTIHTLTICGNDILILINSPLEYKLIHADISTSNTFKEITLTDESTQVSPSRIASDGKNFMIMSTTTELYTCSISSSVLSFSNKTKINMKPDDLRNIFTANGTTYSATENKIVSIHGTDETISYDANMAIDDFSIADNVIYYSTDKKINSYNIISKKIVSKPILENTKSITNLGNDIIITSPSLNRLIVLDKTSLEPKDYYGDSGAELDRLNTPTDVAYDGDDIYIADSNNNRIVVHSGDKITAIPLGTHSPTLVAKTNSKTYFVSNSALYELVSVDGKHNISIIPAVTNVIDIDRYNDKLTVLTSSSVVTLSADNTILHTIPNITNARSIVVPLGTNMLYTTPNAPLSKICKYNLESGALIGSYTSPKTSSHHDFDYRGNLYLTDDQSVDRYTFDSASSTYSKDVISAVTSAASGEISTTININNGDMYITSKTNHKLYKIESKHIASISIVSTDHKPPTDLDVIKVATVSTDDAVALSVPTIPDTSRDLTLGEKVLILTEYGEANEYWYVTYAEENLYEYILKTDLTAPVDNIDLKGVTMSAFNKTNVYRYPYTHTENTTNAIITEISALQPIKALSKVASDGVWDWTKIEITTDTGVQIGYVMSVNIANVTPTAPPDSTVFVKTKSQNIGEKIKMYTTPNLESAVVFADIDDGIDIQVIGKFDSNSTFTKVYYNEKEGYILTANLQESGLTPSQIIAISVSSACLVAFTLILILLLMLKKSRAKKQSIEFTEQQ